MNYQQWEKSVTRMGEVASLRKLRYCKADDEMIWYSIYTNVHWIPHPNRWCLGERRFSNYIFQRDDEWVLHWCTVDHSGTSVYNKFKQAWYTGDILVRLYEKRKGEQEVTTSTPKPEPEPAPKKSKWFRFFF